MLAVGHPREVELLAEAADASRVTVDVLVDVGDRRTAILRGQPAPELARLIAKHSSLRIRGKRVEAIWPIAARREITS